MYGGSQQQQQQHTWSSDPTPNAPGYGGGGGYGGGPMVQPEPTGTALKVFGILGLSFAGINLIYNAFGIIQAILQQRQFARIGSDGAPGSAAFATNGMQEMLDASIKLTIGTNLAMVLMDVALIVIGILLLQRKEIGRKLAIIWAGLGLVVLIGRAVSFEIILMPHLERFMGEFSKGASADSPLSGGLFSAFARVGTYLSLGFMAIWPIALLVAMNLQSVKSAIKQPTA